MPHLDIEWEFPPLTFDRLFGTAITYAHEADRRILPYGLSHLVPKLTEASPGVNQEIWDKYVWNPPGGSATQAAFDARPEVIEKPSWAQLLEWFAAYIRTEIPLFHKELYSAYQRQLVRHSPLIQHKQDLPFLHTRLSTTDNHASGAQMWAEHLFQRYHEMLYLINHANDDVLLAIEVCAGDDDHRPWDEDQIWDDPRWRFHASLPYFDKHENVLQTSISSSTPPSGIFLDAPDTSTLRVRSVSPATIVVSGAALMTDQELELSFEYPGVKLLTLNNFEGVVQASGLAYGKVIEPATLDLSTLTKGA